LRRHLGEQVENRAEFGGARAVHRQQRRSRQIERLRDAAQHADRRIAVTAFDLCQIALGCGGGFRQLPARHAALGTMAPHLASDRRQEGFRFRALALRGRRNILRLRTFRDLLGHGLAPHAL
jgi:hypothetical protein